jgi:hypothetical protein
VLVAGSSDAKGVKGGESKHVLGKVLTLESDAEGEDKEFGLSQPGGTDVFVEIVPCS